MDANTGDNMKTSTQRGQEYRKREKKKRHEVRIFNHPDAIAELKAAVQKINKKYCK